MDDTLKRLLDAEVRAEQLAQEAERAQERVIQQAMEDARRAEERFRASIPELHRGQIDKADERAMQTVAELRRRYDERHIQLRDMAEQREDDALESAFALLIDTSL
ncbi:ATPase [Rhabdochromatium marinum]|uniref:ATPase n=1 Tax=Rhabdochromatium marinum TaxID=48729 RepID=UPI001906A6AD|nr:ATPase [Rhabdochromatium marinum]MBK1647931.1 ATPase [Rhabdochromatium marinum]